jgi:hypothetical protein
MIGAFVTFSYGDDFDERVVQRIAEAARATFEGVLAALVESVRA